MTSRKQKQIINAAAIFDCGNLEKFLNSIVQVMHYKGASASQFCLCEVNGIRFLTKLCFYRKTNPELYGKKKTSAIAHVDAEIGILQELKKAITDANISPCILEMVHYHVCQKILKTISKSKKCENIIPNYGDDVHDDNIRGLICKNGGLIANGLAHDKCAFLVLDKCDITLYEFIKRNVSTPISFAVFKSVIFQVLYTLYAIRVVFPGFRHYDLHTENVMLKINPEFVFDSARPTYMVFDSGEKKFSVPYFGIIAKIIDFGFSALPERDIVSNATEDIVHMYFRSENDALFLFYWIYNVIMLESLDKYKFIVRLLDRLEPNKTYVQYNVDYIREIEKNIPTYRDMINNKVWAEYLVPPPSGARIHAEYSAPHSQKNKHK